jgi:hypothetical protein
VAISPNEAELLWTLWRSKNYYDAYDKIVAYGDLLDAREEAILDLDELIEKRTGESLGWSLSFIFAYLFGEGFGEWSGELDFESAMLTLGFHPTSQSYKHFRELTENLITMLEADADFESALVALQAEYLRTEEALSEIELEFLGEIADRWNNLEEYISKSDERYKEYPSLALKTRHAKAILRLDRLLFGKRDLDSDEISNIIVTAPDERTSESRWDHPIFASNEEVMTYIADREVPGRTPQRSF